MQIKIITTGKTKEKYLKSGIQIYLDRLKHYGRIDYIEGKGTRGQAAPEQQLRVEGDWMLSKIGTHDFVVLLDEKGKHLTSRGLAKQLNQWMNHVGRPICFVIGGAYGFAPEVRARANDTLSLSEMTFSHQMVRLIFTEQLYRAFTILAGQSYHND
jgi:23S rRNA (pseudouridine1915-N3)-methyltransferase